ncbi:Chitin synthase export chaperone [Fusarium euwallaceae]|uniref:Chitin synthase export chaperone n=6 Tax=Fusarium solani species complex TaxID=232080 RepID=A0A428QA88_9HYPO|nr:Chitin synthase export chaperone [Fusarium kuroshium]RSL45584.1 Chitin synthase export chaperone [Fusarium floridanum]RSL62204.1 Chitin synthase export chaperone [Fusarium duplospermum]RSM04151.1 Chitin synthase export chaperone [Fusarium oligoseptatum]RSM20639.1 Chitin synthase export chaperone [Fusarium ambrosium]RTE72983.1 Chitin synthase export chaperone [Fusarium euwallaceae]
MSSFGDFRFICEIAPLPLCAQVGPVIEASGRVGIEPECYARNIELANTIIFEGAASVMHIVALIMTVIMILHVRSKFTAVGRKEILSFFYLYMLLTAVSLIVDAGVAPPGSDPYPYFVSVQNGLSSAVITCLLINGFVGFQLYEDGTPLSVWMLRVCSLVAFAIGFLVSLATFKSWAGLEPNKTIGLFVVLYLLNAIQLFVYVAMQILLVTRTLQDRWPLGDIAFGIFFFVAGQVLLYAFSAKICVAISHYIDGLFLATVCNLLGVMMVYKYWDSITKEDLEFSVGTRMNNWEVKELLPEEERRATVFSEDPYGHSSSYDLPYSPSAARYSAKY